MGDKSPKSKKRGQEQKDAVKAHRVKQSKDKQTAQAAPVVGKGKK